MRRLVQESRNAGVDRLARLKPIAAFEDAGRPRFFARRSASCRAPCGHCFQSDSISSASPQLGRCRRQCAKIVSHLHLVSLRGIDREASGDARRDRRRAGQVDGTVTESRKRPRLLFIKSSEFHPP